MSERYPLNLCLCMHTAAYSGTNTLHSLTLIKPKLIGISICFTNDTENLLVFLLSTETKH